MDKSIGKLNDNYIFGLDIGTRSVVGVVGYRAEDKFQVVAYAMEEHATRSMIDGQIHDIDQVTSTIVQVKETLEKTLGFTLHKACIAAAGRVLKTAMIHVEQAIDPMVIIDESRINALELLGMEKAHQEVNDDLEVNEMGYHCVGYTVSKYYLNDYEISSLKDHKGKKIGADVLATFLPQEVVGSLHLVVQNAGMEVYSLTLEPIAAINVAIPDQFRLLNIGLIDVGAGTSDIAITKNGSIIAYGMIPMAGDEMTEALVHKYLVDFNTAESIKRKAYTKAKTVVFKDIMGNKHNITTTEINGVLDQAVDEIVQKISDQLKKLNGGQSTNAVFIVGGGGQVKSFTKKLSQALSLKSERVGLRGKEVLDAVDFGTLNIKKGPELVTPIGICLTGIDNNRHDFIQVYLNDEPLRIYNNNHLSVMDVAAYKSLNPKKLLAKRGRDLVFSVNGSERKLPGSPGIPAIIRINNEPASLTSRVVLNDYISIIEAKEGQSAGLSTYQLLKELDLKVYLDEKVYPLMPDIYVNDTLMEKNYDIHENDMIRLKLPTLQSFIVKNSLEFAGWTYYINGNLCDDKTSLADTDHITRKLNSLSNHEMAHDKATKILVTVNQAPVQLEGKTTYVFVDIFEVYPFDLSKPKGNVVCKINGIKASYLGAIQDGDQLEIYWDN